MAYDVQITRHGAMALFDLKGDQASIAKHVGKALPPFPTTPNTFTEQGETKFAHIGQNHWLVLAPLTEESSLDIALTPTSAPSDISIVHISDTLCFFAITGPDADQILSIASTLDLHMLPHNGITFTEAFALKALITRRPGGYWLAIEQSFGDMIEDYLTRANAPIAG